MDRRRAAGIVLALIICLSVLSAPAQAWAPVSASAAASSSSSARTEFAPLRLGDKGWRVRGLQSRLHELDLHSEVVTSRFDPETRAGVKSFQRRRGWRTTGVVKRRMWARLVSRTEKPTNEALHNIYKPGRPLLKRGDRGKQVRQVQARLKQLRRYKGRVTGRYGLSTVTGVRGFQTKRRIPVTGEVDRRTLERLRTRTRKPTRAELFNTMPALDARCRVGRAICIDKTSRSLSWVVDGNVRTSLTMKARFGSAKLPTREGAFSVFQKSRHHVSSIYGTPMPFAMFFSGGQAVHYSHEFAVEGYDGASHGCVNVRSRARIAKLYDRVRLGDKVIVYRS